MRHPHQRARGSASCRTPWVRTRTESCPTPMNSSHYSPPPIPSDRKLADMILWYSTPEFRDQLIFDRIGMENDGETMDELVAVAKELIASWVPTTDLHVSYVKVGRQVEWMVWQVAMMGEGSWNQAWFDGREPWPIAVSSLEICWDGQWTELDNDPGEPWAIKISTLPRYPGEPETVWAPRSPL